MRQVHRCTVCLIVLTIGLNGGCSRFHTEYGESEGVQGTKSLNGFGAFRSAIADIRQDADSTVMPSEGPAFVPTVKIRDLGRLSSRADQFDAIVWIPKSWPPVNGPAVATWMDRWLKKGDKTMVFVVPDAGSTESYFREASSMAPPEQRLEYRRRLANQINDRLLEDGRRKDVILDDWFVAKALPFRVILSDRRIVDYSLEGAPAPVIPIDDDEIDLDQIDMTEVDDAKLMAEIDAMLAAGEFAEDDTADHDGDVNGREAEPTRPIMFEALQFENGKGDSRSGSITTLARVTDSRWKGSQILVVASGSLVTNFAMTSASAIKLTDRIRESMLQTASPGGENPDPTDAAANQDVIEVGLLSSDNSMVPISNAKPGAPAATGMELLTTWPLSLVTMHGLFLGVVMCLMLLPAFGRARRVTYNRTTHFGNHLSAMAALMRRSDRKVDGTLFARTKISQYLRAVRGESSGPWVLPESSPEVVGPSESGPSESGPSK